MEGMFLFQEFLQGESTVYACLRLCMRMPMRVGLKASISEQKQNFARGIGYMELYNWTLNSIRYSTGVSLAIASIWMSQDVR